jgi:hypothetical protein
MKQEKAATEMLRLIKLPPNRHPTHKPPDKPAPRCRRDVKGGSFGDAYYIPEERP